MKELKFEAAILLADEIDSAYSNTPYAALAGLQKAKAQLETGDRKAALDSLEKVAASDSNPSIQHVARVRAFRIRIGDGDLNGVIADIDSVMAEEKGVNPGEFIGQYEALKGDAYRLLGDIEKARHGYIAALRNATLDRRIIQLKLDDLGPPPAGFSGDSTEQVPGIEK
jgi:predicted negative regulator of RcsB-dependent stress response